MHAGSFHGLFSIEGKTDSPMDRSLAPIRIVSPGYFHVMKIPILSGRDYDEHDEVGPVGSLPSVIVSRTLAERFWPGQDAVGKKVRMSFEKSPSVIIGVVGDVRYAGLDEEPEGEFYFPEGLWPQSAITLLVRTDRDHLRLYSDMAQKNCRDRQRCFCLRREGDGAAHFGFARAPPVLDHSVVDVRGYRPHAFAGGHLRSDRALGRTTHGRDRFSRRDGSFTCQCHRPDASIRTSPRDLRPGRRVVGRICDFTAFCGNAIRRRTLRCCNVGSRFRLHARCDMHRKLPACPSRVQRRSNRRASGGVVASRLRSIHISPFTAGASEI